MSISTKRAIIIVLFLSFGFFVVFPLVVWGSYAEGLNLDVSGRVVYIKWHTYNHDLPLFKIKENTGAVISLNDGGLKLKESEIKVGDSIVKKKGSQICSVNGVNIKCVHDYISFYSMLGGAIKSLFGKKHA